MIRNINYSSREHSGEEEDKKRWKIVDKLKRGIYKGIKRSHRIKVAEDKKVTGCSRDLWDLLVSRTPYDNNSADDAILICFFVLIFIAEHRLMILYKLSTFY